MNKPDTKLEILTLGRFSISVDGKPVAIEWPDETIKVFFCSLLSPLDLYETWDRVCRAMLGIRGTQAGRRQLEEMLIRPLNSFLVKELGFNPLIAGHEGIRIDRRRIYLDALEFHGNVVEGLKLLALGNQGAAIEKFSLANSLYAGDYLAGMPGKIIANTRNELEALYRTSLRSWTQNRSNVMAVEDGKIILASGAINPVI